jgi:GNAT superfamily N-acetyltransferase
MPDAPLAVMTTSLTSPIATQLIAALDAELRQRYPDHEFVVPLGPDEVTGGYGRFLIAYRGDQPVGCGAVRRLHDDVGEVLRMYVVPGERGHGIGAAILGALEEEAAEIGLAELVLETGGRLAESVVLYEHHGYQRNEARNPLLGTDAIFMRKRIAPA